MKLNPLNAVKKINQKPEVRLRRPISAEFKKYMTTGWGNDSTSKIRLTVPKQFVAKRRVDLSAQFLKECLVIHAGTAPVRNNDCDYKFRPSTDFTYLTGLGLNYESQAVLVFEPVDVKLPSSKNNPIGKILSNEKHSTHIITLYINEPHGYSDDRFFTDPKTGEFWNGKRPGLKDFEIAIGVRVLPLSSLEKTLSGLKSKYRIREVYGENSNLKSDEKLSGALSEMRLQKDAWEIEEMKKAIQATKHGFERVMSRLPEMTNKESGEKIVEGIFNLTAITQGNDVGYGTIAASGEHATILHWMENSGELKDNELLLLDAGVEVDSLYTADITRTVPISGTFNLWQRQIYDAVLAAADAGIKAAKPGALFKDVHTAAIDVLTEKLIDLNIIKMSFEEAKSKEIVRRWMCHGTSHHLGLDVHDCSNARETEYHGELKQGMIITVEPGLYFQPNDELVVKEYRGIGIRIEDDILITDEGCENLSSALPRNREHLESWLKLLQTTEKPPLF